MKTKANVWLLPIDLNSIQPKDCIGFLFLNENNVLNQLFDLEDIIKSNAYFKNIPQHLYITLPQSDLEISKIKEGDWYITKEHILQCGIGCINEEKDCEKIIATTNSSLKIIIPRHNDFDSEYSLSSIPQQFIEYYINEYNKGNITKQIDVELSNMGICNKCGATQLLSYCTCNYNGICDGKVVEQLKLNKQNEISIIIPEEKQSYSKEEVETILFNFAENNGLLGSSSDIEYFNEWIKENLK